jgi:hypothetical protein
MERNTPRLVDLLEELATLTWQKKIHWEQLDDGRSYQYQGPRAVAVILSQGENDEGPYVLSLRSGGKDTASLSEAATPNGQGPETWNGMLAYLHALAKRASNSSPAGFLADLGLPGR